MVKISNPFFGESGVFNDYDDGKSQFGENAGRWLTGEAAFNDITGGTSPAMVDFTAGTYGVNPMSFQFNDPYAGQWEQLIADAQGRGGSTMNAAIIDPSMQAQARQQQQMLVDMLLNQARGFGSSVAEQQLFMGQDRGMAQNLAMGASSRGGIGGANLRDALMANADMGAQTNQQAALLRAQEQMAAMGMLGQTTGQMREGDINFAAQQASFEQQAGTANLQAAMQQKAMNDALVQHFMSMNMSAEQAQLQANIEMQRIQAEQYANSQSLNMQAAIANQQAEQQTQGGLLGAAGAALGFLSDERVKTDIVKGDEAVDEWLEHLAAKKFKYAWDEDETPNYAGIMAQDMERSSIGRSIVTEVEGVKSVDGQRALMAALAGLARLDKRLSNIEGK